MRPYSVVVLGLLSFACSHAMVANHPKTLLLGATYQKEAVRDAVARALHRRKMSPQTESAGRVVAVATHKTPVCIYDVAYSDHEVTIATSPTGAPGAAPPPSIDERCLEEADKLAKVIAQEVGRPAQEAAKAEQARRNHELAVERERRMAEQAALAAQQQQQQQLQNQNPDSPAYAGPAQPPVVQNINLPASGPTVNYQSTNVVKNQTSHTNTTTNYTVVNQAPPPQPAQPQIKPLLCCQRGQGYVCPSTEVYAAACVQHPEKVPTFCKLDPEQARYCRK